MSQVRPWQGTALGVIDIIGTVGAFIAALIFLAFQGMLTGISQMAAESAVTTSESVAATGVFGFLGSMGMVVGVIFLALGVLMIFMAIGAFKGQKWAPIVNIIFAVLGLLSLLSGMGHMGSSTIISLAINVFAGYCAYICISHPFYGKK